MSLEKQRCCKIFIPTAPCSPQCYLLSHRHGANALREQWEHEDEISLPAWLRCLVLTTHLTGPYHSLILVP